ncbi:MAG: hypothetical protein ACP5D8_09970 [Fidelibacterota bacterium]
MKNQIESKMKHETSGRCVRGIDDFHQSEMGGHHVEIIGQIIVRPAVPVCFAEMLRIPDQRVIIFILPPKLHAF